MSESEGQLTLGDGKASTERLRVEIRNGSFEVESLRLIWYAEKTGTRLFRFMQAGAVETADPRACEADAKALHHSPLIHTEATYEYNSTLVYFFDVFNSF